MSRQDVASTAIEPAIVSPVSRHLYVADVERSKTFYRTLVRKVLPDL